MSLSFPDGVSIMYTIESYYYPFLGLFALLFCSCAALAQLLKPNDLKSLPRGKRPWSMPPGPPGVPILGNLRQMMDARKGALSLNYWVG